MLNMLSATIAGKVSYMLKLFSVTLMNMWITWNENISKQTCWFNTGPRHTTLAQCWTNHMMSAWSFACRGSVPGLGGLKETKLFLPHPRVKVSIVGSLRDREVACSASDRQGSNFESCVWRTVSSQSSHHPQEVLLAQFSLYVHKGGLKPDSFHFFIFLCVPHWHSSLKMSLWLLGTMY